MTKKQSDISNSLLAGNFERSSPDAKELSDPIVDTPMVLTLDQLRPYELNPRLTRNPLYDEIKTSILQRGLDNPPSVTRRPGQEHYIIHNGGNTRLKILGELWSETKNEQFFRILCIFKPWKSEIVALTGHLAENELHGKLTFIERALGVGEAKKIYEEENHTPISQAELAKRLTQDGYPCDQSQISRMQDTVNILLPAIPNALYGGLHMSYVRKILKLRKSSQLFWMNHAKDNRDEQHFAYLFEDVLTQFDTEPADLDYERFQDELIGQIASASGCNYDYASVGILCGSPRTQNTTKTEPAPPPSPTLPPETQIPQDFVKPDLSEVMQQAQHHASKFILQPKGNPTTGMTSPIAPTPSIADDESGPEANCDEKALIEAHIVSPAETSEKVQSIQQMVARHIGEEISDFSENVLKAIPVQAGGLYPISDVWYIEPSVDTPEVLRIHIEQLAVEIADETDCKDQIVQNEEGIGYTCQIDNANAVLSLLGAISGSPDGQNASTVSLYEQLASVLIGSSTHNRLSDEALVKLFRLIRLARRLTDLTVHKNYT
ncbi:hypothetical protein CUZ56_00260 [Saezia sanguinis]|uniref:Uncharacterized protein n=1 Tax=Saezia sanguinis TaxID=1965230 RepID=A0A433SGB1_9BURK|nr:ParB family protein [Saezia sanguinis]RUS67783.1 hypothetical protein CUZ56_00260 [Saezia sanguinis]